MLGTVAGGDSESPDPPKRTTTPASDLLAVLESSDRTLPMNLVAVDVSPRHLTPPKARISAD
jgi:hypothetical protein